MLVKESYLKDNEEIFSPVISLGSVINSNKEDLQTKWNNSKRSKFLFYSEIYIGTPSTGGFVNVNLSSSDVRFGSNCFGSNGFVDNEISSINGIDYGLYEVYINYQADNMNGTGSKRDIGVGFSINGSTGDGSGNFCWGSQVYDRYGICFRNIVKLTKGQYIRPQYYVDGTGSKTFGTICLGVKRLSVNITSPISSDSVSTVSSKYVKNENNEIISPITSSESVRCKNDTNEFTNSEELYKNRVMNVSYNNSLNLIFSSGTSRTTKEATGGTANNAVTAEKFGQFSDYNSIRTTKIKYSGWYLIEISGRLTDYQGDDDYRITLYTTNTNYILWSRKFYLRRGFYGHKFIHLQQGEEIWCNFWSDKAFTGLSWYSSRVQLLSVD